MYLLNHVEPLGLDDSEVDLHSTMYLLNPPPGIINLPVIRYLHSTMYLLNRCHPQPCTTPAFYLHSTMYLLNRPRFAVFAADGSRFTFHYVSIKSTFEAISTAVSNVFTFHYVSIKSPSVCSACC